MDSPSKVAPSPQRPAAARAERSIPVRRIRAGAVIAVALVVAFGAWLVVRDGGASAEPDGPVSSAASLAQLRTLPDQTGHPVYWAGARAGQIYELTRPTDGNVYLRYLPPGVSLGDRQPDYTTIGTYPRPRALRSLRKLASRPDAQTFPLADGGIALYSRDRPRSVYLAFPGGDVQVEVYDPSPRKARSLARSGQVRPIG